MAKRPKPSGQPYTSWTEANHPTTVEDAAKARVLPGKPVKPCHNCHGTDWWMGEQGMRWTCSVCHPNPQDIGPKHRPSPLVYAPGNPACVYCGKGLPCKWDEALWPCPRCDNTGVIKPGRIEGAPLPSHRRPAPPLPAPSVAQPIIEGASVTRPVSSPRPTPAPALPPPTAPHAPSYPDPEAAWADLPL